MGRGNYVLSVWKAKMGDICAHSIREFDFTKYRTFYWHNTIYCGISILLIDSMRDHLKVQRGQALAWGPMEHRIAQKCTLPASCACGYAPCMTSGRVDHEAYLA